jgi:hypothetical protein
MSARAGFALMMRAAATLCHAPVAGGTSNQLASGNSSIKVSQVDYYVAQINVRRWIYYQTLVPQLSTREYFFVTRVAKRQRRSFRVA